MKPSVPRIFSALVTAAIVLQLLPATVAFSAPRPSSSASIVSPQIINPPRLAFTELYAISDKRRKELGLGEQDDEYDLEMALNNNTDPLITKIIAGSFILVMVSLLVVGLVIPYTTDYGEGVCNPLLTAGRC